MHAAVNECTLRSRKLAALAMKKGFDSDWRIHVTRPNQTLGSGSGLTNPFPEYQTYFQLELGFDPHQRIHLTGANQTLSQETGSPFRFLNIKLSVFNLVRV